MVAVVLHKRNLKLHAVVRVAVNEALKYGVQLEREREREREREERERERERQRQRERDRRSVDLRGLSPSLSCTSYIHHRRVVWCPLPSIALLQRPEKRAREK